MLLSIILHMKDMIEAITQHSNAQPVIKDNSLIFV